MRTEALFYIFAYPLKVWLNMKELGSHMFLHSVCCNIWLKYMKKVQSQRHVVRRGRSVLLTFSDHYTYSSLIQHLSILLNSKRHGQALGYILGIVWSEGNRDRIPLYCVSLLSYGYRHNRYCIHF